MTQDIKITVGSTTITVVTEAPQRILVGDPPASADVAREAMVASYERTCASIESQRVALAQRVTALEGELEQARRAAGLGAQRAAKAEVDGEDLQAELNGIDALLEKRGVHVDANSRIPKFEALLERVYACPHPRLHVRAAGAAELYDAGRMSEHNATLGVLVRCDDCHFAKQFDIGVEVGNLSVDARGTFSEIRGLVTNAIGGQVAGRSTAECVAELVKLYRARSL